MWKIVHAGWAGSGHNFGLPGLALGQGVVVFDVALWATISLACITFNFCRYSDLNLPSTVSGT